MRAEDFNWEIEGDYRIEAGLIAQDILEIQELAFVVSGGGKITNADLSGIETTSPNHYSVDYNSIFTYGIAGIQELDALMTDQASEIADLKSIIERMGERLDALEN